MNISILYTDITQCARYHCDQHVVKMILESVQVLYMTLNKKGFTNPYRSTHTIHPCVRRVEESYDNFYWLCELTHTLHREYQFRYRKTENHNFIAVLNAITGLKYPSRGLTEFAQAMPDKYKVSNNPVKAYRKFYLGKKYTLRDGPEERNLTGSKTLSR